VLGCGSAILKIIKKQIFFFKIHLPPHPFQQAHLCVKRNL
jgi:hypothetical protein